MTATLEVGQEVWLFAARRDRERGTVVKVGRKLVTIRAGERDWDERQYRLASGIVNDNWGHHWFKTDEQVALDDRVSAARAALLAAGLSVRSYADLSLETLEAVAAVLAGLGSSDKGDQHGND